MTKILGIDFETQGADATKDLPTEVGCVLHDIERGVDETFNALIYESHYPPQPSEIVEITGITDEMLKAEGKPRAFVLSEIRALMLKADFVMAYNKQFDETVLTTMASQVNETLPEKEWVCGYRDVPWPARFKCRKLSHLALDHGLKMDGRALHRAVDDVQLMLELVLGQYKFEEVLAYKRIPDVVIRAVVPHPKQDGGKGKDLAKASGFRWQEVDGKVYNLCWVRKVKEHMVAEIKKDFPYPVVILK